MAVVDEPAALVELPLLGEDVAPLVRALRAAPDGVAQERGVALLGRCDEGLPYIDASETIQGSRAEFREARAKCDD